jgi:hypothetical protein
MHTRSSLPLVALVCCGLAAPSGANDELAGTWVGELDLGGRRSLITLRWRDGGDGAQGTLELWRQPAVELEGVRLEPPRIRFELGDGAATLAFAGRLEDGELAGEVRRGDERGKFRTIRTVDLDSPALADVGGTYRVTPQRTLWIGPFAELGSGLFLLDSATGRFAPLHAVSTTELVAAQTFAAAFFPLDARLALIRDDAGRPTALTFGKAAPRRCRRPGWARRGKTSPSATAPSP